MHARTILLALGLTAAGCGELPGDVVGTYRVEMTLDENTCGALAVNTLDGHAYSVELRSDDSHGYWRIPGQPPIQGSYDAPSFHFEYSAIVASDPDAGPNGCRLRQTEVLEGNVTLSTAPQADGGVDSDDATIDAGALDAGVDDGGLENDDAGPESADAALQGTHEMTVAAVAGTDCREALAPEGAFEHLPCTVRYTLTGKTRSPF